MLVIRNQLADGRSKVDHTMGDLFWRTELEVMYIISTLKYRVQTGDCWRGGGKGAPPTFEQNR